MASMLGRRSGGVIMTSNIGSHHLLDGVTADGEIKPAHATG